MNTIGKQIHTLVKENTPCCHKTRQECGFTQKVAFFCISLCFLPRCCANIGREVRLMLPYTYQEIYDKILKAGSGVRKPRREFEGSALELFFHVFLSLNYNGFFIVQLNYHIKASVKLIEFVKENQIIPWQGVYFFTNTVLQKS